jgi:hypothetical protein
VIKAASANAPGRTFKARQFARTFAATEINYRKV